jgi:hypothetical protein
MAAIVIARIVTLLDPGIRTVASSGPSAFVSRSVFMRRSLPGRFALDNGGPFEQPDHARNRSIWITSEILAEFKGRSAPINSKAGLKRGPWLEVTERHRQCCIRQCYIRVTRLPLTCRNAKRTIDEMPFTQEGVAKEGRPLPK